MNTSSKRRKTDNKPKVNNVKTTVNFDKRLADLERKVNVLGDALGVRQPAPMPSLTEAPNPTFQYLVLVGTTMDDVPVALCDTVDNARILANQPDLWRIAERTLKDVFHRDVPEFTGVSIVTIRNEGRIRYPTVFEYVRDFTPPPAKPAAPTDDAVAAHALNTKVDELTKELRGSNDCNEQLRARVKELEIARARHAKFILKHYKDPPLVSQLQSEVSNLKEENASLMAKAEAQALALEFHRARTGFDR